LCEVAGGASPGSAGHVAEEDVLSFPPGEDRRDHPLDVPCGHRIQMRPDDFSAARADPCQRRCGKTDRVTGDHMGRFMDRDAPHQRVAELRLHPVGCRLKVLERETPPRLARSGPCFPEKSRDLGPGQAEELIRQQVDFMVRHSH